MISERTKRVKPSATLQLNATAQAMKRQGIDVLSFSVGEPDFDTPEHIKEAAIRALKEGKTKYTPVGGIPELKEAICEKLHRDNGLSYSPDEVIVSCGAKHSLYNIFQAILNPADEVIILSPYWVSYPAQVLLNDGIPVFVETLEENNFQPTRQSIEEAITPKTKAIVLNSPSNPTGQIYTRETLEMVGEIALRHNLIIISDEIYEKLLYDGQSHISIASLSEELKGRTIVVNGLSKSHSMTGWRIGYAAGPKEIVSAMTKVQGQSTSNPTSVAQWAAVEALKGPQDFLKDMLEEFDRRRKAMVQGLNQIDGIKAAMPKGAFYVFANVKELLGKKFKGKTIESSNDLGMFFLEQARVAAVAGAEFGTEGYIRFSYATSMERIEEGLRRISQALQNLE